MPIAINSLSLLVTNDVVGIYPMNNGPAAGFDRTICTAKQPAITRIRVATIISEYLGGIKM